MNKIGFSLIITLIIVLFLSVLAYLPFPRDVLPLTVKGGEVIWPQTSPPDQTYTLDGEWILSLPEQNSEKLQKVPSVAWSSGHGTYRLDMHFSEADAGKRYELTTQNFGTSARLLFNGEIIGEQGVYGESSDTARPTVHSDIYTFTPENGLNTLQVQVSNFVHPRAGIWEQIFIAPAPVLERYHDTQIAIDLFMFGSLLFLALFNVILAAQIPKGKPVYFLAAAVVSVALGNIMRNTFVITMFLPDISYIMVKKGAFIFYYLAAAFMFRSYKELEESIHLQVRLFFWFVIALSACSVILPFRISYYISYPFYIFAIGITLALLFNHIQQIFASQEEVSYRWGGAHILSDMILIYAIAHDAYQVLLAHYDYSVVPIATYLFAIIHSFFLVKLLLEERSRNERAKSLIIHEDTKLRNRLRNDLHDRLGQLTYGLEYLAESLMLTPFPERETIQQVRDTASEVNHELRNVLNGLGTPRIEEVGFRESIEEMAKKASQTYQIDVDTDIEYTPHQSWSAEAEQLYLVVKEAITNASRHARPTYIRVEIRCLSDTVSLRITNDGAENNPFSIRKGRGHGLEIMKYRIKELGGDFRIAPLAKGIFSIEARVPLENRD